MYININIKNCVDLCVLRSQIITPTNPLGGGGGKFVFFL